MARSATTTKAKDAKTTIKTNTDTAIAERVMKEAMNENITMKETIAKAEKAEKDAKKFAESDFCPEALKEMINGADTYITEKIARINELYGIDAQAMKIVDMVSAYNLAKAEMDAENELCVKEWEDKIASVKAEYDKTSEVLKVQRKNDEDDYQRDLARKHKIEDEARVEKIDAQKKEIATRIAEVTERETLLDEKDAKIAELQAIVDGIDAQIVDAVKKAEGKAKAMAESKAETDAKIVATENKSEIEKLKFQIEMLKNQLADANAQRDKANAQVEATNKRIEDITKAFANGQSVTINQTTSGK